MSDEASFDSCDRPHGSGVRLERGARRAARLSGVCQPLRQYGLVAGAAGQWVQDRDENGWATVVHVQTNYDKNRYCQALPAAQGWDYCNFDHIEGKCVHFRLYELKDGVTRHQTGWSPWYGTEYGSPC